MDFNFQSYLAGLASPSSSSSSSDVVVVGGVDVDVGGGGNGGGNAHGYYEIEVLTGGLVNVTVRARVVSSSSSSSSGFSGGSGGSGGGAGAGSVGAGSSAPQAGTAPSGSSAAAASSDGLKVEGKAETETEMEMETQRGVESAGFKLPQTMILKYAPPFVAALGEGAPFTRDRQVCFYLFKSFLSFFPPSLWFGLVWLFVLCLGLPLEPSYFLSGCSFRGGGGCCFLFLSLGGYTPVECRKNTRRDYFIDGHCANQKKKRQSKPRPWNSSPLTVPSRISMLRTVTITTTNNKRSRRRRGRSSSRRCCIDTTPRASSLPSRIWDR